MEQIKLELIIRALEEKKIEQIETISVEHKNPFCSYFVIGTMLNARQGEAVADYIEEQLEKVQQHVRLIEGKKESEWILIDCHDIIVHLFTAQERARVDLDTLAKK